MSIPSNEMELAELFRKLGAPDPEDWARSQVREGIPQLHRFLFLRQAWSDVLADGDTGWIDGTVEDSTQNPTAPYAGLGQALSRALESGASREDLSEIVRSMQAHLLFRLCYRLEDPMFEEDELEDISWGLFQTDEGGDPVSEQICGLHESVLETDPTGREMRPRDRRDA